jgi:ligand-binding sensor domain-containing protein
LRNVLLVGIIITVVNGILFTQGKAQTVSWSKLRGPYSGSIQLLTVDPSGNIFAATSGGVYRSTDQGGNWQLLGIHLEYGSMFLLADSSDNIYTGNQTEGLYQSTNEGMSWEKLNPNGSVYSVAVLPVDRLCVGGLQTVSTSNDHGQTWLTSQLTSLPLEVLSFTQDSSGNIYAGLQALSLPPNGPSYGGGVFISSNGAKIWKPDGMDSIGVVSMTADKNGKIFCLTDGNEIFSAPSQSSLWSTDKLGIPNGANIITLLSDTLKEAVAVTDDGVFVYDDLLSDWKLVLSEISLTTITSAYYDPKGTNYAGTEEDGIFSQEHSSSEWLQSGIFPASITSVGSDEANDLFAGTGDGVFEQDSKTGKWLRVSDGLERTTVYKLYYSTTSKRLYALTGEGAFYLPDNQNYWIPVISGTAYDFIESSSGDKYIATSGRIYKAVNSEDDWFPLFPIGFPLTTAYCLALDASNNLFAGTSRNGVFVSIDGGTFWNQTGVNSPFIFYSVKAMGIDNAGRIFAGTDTSGAYYTDDSGIDWNPIPSINGKSISCLLVDSSEYFAGTLDRGVFASTDGGLSWQSVNSNLMDSSVASLAFDQDGYLYAATDSGIFKSNTSIVTDVHETEDRTPLSFSLYQNYPNPFNPSTVIRYQLSSRGFVTLTIYDVLGREVRTLVNDVQQQGSYTVTFNANGLSSGLYFYRLAANNKIETKKMMLIK